ncbi:MAG: hypothetical protein KF705_04295 [Phycisphaeraceae bacterium]|nr:hypothetical protein [Phycisphaeraceae bacterium]
MHGFAGQLDLRKLSGVGKMKGWLVVTVAMFVGCLNLAGFPFTAGFFSKDMILAEAFVDAPHGADRLDPAAHGGSDRVLHLPRLLPRLCRAEVLRAGR